jgi:hypothetical protein
VARTTDDAVGAIALMISVKKAGSKLSVDPIGVQSPLIDDRSSGSRYLTRMKASARRASRYGTDREWQNDGERNRRPGSLIQCAIGNLV